MKEPVWVSRIEIETLHDRMIAMAGGAEGLRDSSLLDSALSRPMNHFSYGETNIFRLAAGYAEAVALNHPFVDGNKRTAFAAATVFLLLNGFDLREAELSEHADMMVELAQGNITRDDAAEHLRKHSDPLD